MANFYEILEVSAQATPDEVKKAYRRLIYEQKLHPDLGGLSHTAALINEAYNTLKDPHRRAQYDQWLRRPAQYSRNIQRYADTYTETAPIKRPRKIKRYGIPSQKIRMGKPQDPLLHMAQIVDLSPSGGKINSSSRLWNPHDLIRIVADDFEAHGRIVWVNPIKSSSGCELGVRFDTFQTHGASFISDRI